MNIMLVGKPGSGKGTVANKLLEEGFIQLSVGDLLRKEISRGTDLGRELGDLLKGGNFAPIEVTLDLVSNYIKENEGKSIIFDGFPRNIEQATKCSEMGIEFDALYVFNVSDDVVKDRIINRRVHEASGRVYNTKFNPPINEGLDDITNEPLVSRTDDSLSVIEKRLEIYSSVTEPIISYLSGSVKVFEIDASMPTKEQIEIIKFTLKKSKKFNPL